MKASVQAWPLEAEYFYDNLLVINQNTGVYHIETNKFIAQHLLRFVKVNNYISGIRVIDEYILKVKKLLYSKPNISNKQKRMVYVELTYRCNLFCRHCYNLSGHDNNCAIDVDKLVISLKDSLDCNTPIILSGGEPLLYEKFEEVYMKIKKYFRNIYVYTNGTLIDKRINFIVKNGIKLIISLDGCSKEQHDKVRGNGNFERTLSNVKKLSKRYDLKKNVKFSFTVNRFNYKSIEDMIKIGLQYKAQKVFFIPVSKLGRGDANADEIGLNPEQLLTVWNTLSYMQTKYKKITIDADTYWKRNSILNDNFIPWDCSACHKLKIDPKGNVYPCTFFTDKSTIIQNIYNESLLYKNTNYVKIENKIRQRENSLRECKKCILRKICYSGCAAKSFTDNGKINSISINECKVKKKFLSKSISEKR